MRLGGIAAEGLTCLKLSVVVRICAWPSISMTTLGCTPSDSSRVASVCRREALLQWGGSGFEPGGRVFGARPARASTPAG